MTCFNPCFNGSVERGSGADSAPGFPLRVSILVLMEVLREAKEYFMFLTFDG